MLPSSLFGSATGQSHREERQRFSPVPSAQGRNIPLREREDSTMSTTQVAARAQGAKSNTALTSKNLREFDPKAFLR
jgi:hypothetical protein